MTGCGAPRLHDRTTQRCGREYVCERCVRLAWGDDEAATLAEKPGLRRGRGGGIAALLRDLGLMRPVTRGGRA